MKENAPMKNENVTPGTIVIPETVNQESARTAEKAAKTAARFEAKLIASIKESKALVVEAIKAEQEAAKAMELVNGTDAFEESKMTYEAILAEKEKELTNINCYIENVCKSIGNLSVAHMNKMSCYLQDIRCNSEDEAEAAAAEEDYCRIIEAEKMSRLQAQEAFLVRIAEVVKECDPCAEVLAGVQENVLEFTEKVRRKIEENTKEEKVEIKGGFDMNQTKLNKVIETIKKEVAELEGMTLDAVMNTVSGKVSALAAKINTADTAEERAEAEAALKATVKEGAKQVEIASTRALVEKKAKVEEVRAKHQATIDAANTESAEIEPEKIEEAKIQVAKADVAIKNLTKAISKTGLNAKQEFYAGVVRIQQLAEQHRKAEANAVKTAQRESRIKTAEANHQRNLDNPNSKASKNAAKENGEERTVKFLGEGKKSPNANEELSKNINERINGSKFDKGISKEQHKANKEKVKTSYAALVALSAKPESLENNLVKARNLTDKYAVNAIRKLEVLHVNSLFGEDLKEAEIKQAIRKAIAIVSAPPKKVLAGKVNIYKKPVVNYYTLEKLYKLGASRAFLIEVNKIIDESKVSAKVAYDRHMIKRWTKKLEGIAMFQIEITKPFGEAAKKAGKLKASVNVITAQESALLRVCSVTPMRFADTIFSRRMNGTLDVAYLKLSGIIGDEYTPEMVENLFNLIAAQGDGNLYLIHKKNGQATVAFEEPHMDNDPKRADSYMEIGTKAVKLELVNISPSGYRSASIVVGSTIRYWRDENGIHKEACDKRLELVDAANDGSIKMSFLQEDKFGNVAWKSMDKLKAFKNAIRIANCNAPSRVSFAVSNSIVFDNIAEKACYSKITPGKQLPDETVIKFFEEITAAEKARDAAKAALDKDATEENAKAYNDAQGKVAKILNTYLIVRCGDTKDGNVFAASESQHKFFKENGEPISLDAITGTTFQTRGHGSLKSSMTFKKRDELKVLARHLLAIKQEIRYVMCDGKRISAEDLTSEQLEHVIENVDVIADMNSIKLENHANFVSITVLKMAYDSQTKFSQILNIAMCNADMEATLALLQERFLLLFQEAFKQAGVIIPTDENGAMQMPELHLDSVKKLANSDQVMEQVIFGDPVMAAACIPFAYRRILSNNIKTLAKRLTNLDMTCDSAYSVVQADPAVLFGFRTINDNEFYCSDRDQTAKDCVAIRQPMSGDSAVTYFKRLGLSEIYDRIYNSGCDKDVAVFLANYYADAHGYNIIPASHYLMEKHDGMDWDIDAMMFYYDAAIVAICKKMPEIGTKIVRTKSDWMNTDGDKMVVNFQAGQGILKRLEGIKAAKDFKGTRKGAFAIGASVKEAINESEAYDVSFETVRFLAKSVFTNPIADVGTIVSGFYNNALIKLCLKKGIRVKEICKQLRKKYHAGEISNIPYKSPIKEEVCEEGYTQRILTKETVIEAMVRFAESRGNLEDCLAFIEDCCTLNRYAAETSIDAAKQAYIMLDYVNHRDIIRCLGMDKHLRFEAIENKAVLAKEVLGGQYRKDDETLISEIYEEARANACYVLTGEEGAEVTRFFELPLLTDVVNTKKALVVEDPIATLKYEICTSVNAMIVAVDSCFRNFVASEEAREIRRGLMDKFKSRTNIDIAELVEEAQGDYSNVSDAAASEAICTNFMNSEDAGKIIKNICTAYTALTESTTEGNLKSAMKSDDFDEYTKKDYINNLGVFAIGNFARMAFGNKSSVDIGILLVMFYVIDLALRIDNRSTVTTINPGLVRVMEEEFLAGLSYFGFKNVTTIGEKVDAIVDLTNSEYVRASDFEYFCGEEVEIVDGHGFVSFEGEEFEVRTDNKKANIYGMLDIVDGKLYVVSERESKADEDVKDMIFCSYQPTNESSFNSFNELIAKAERYEFTPYVGQGTQNTLWAYVDNKPYKVCTLGLSKHAAEYLKAASELGLLTADNVSVISDLDRNDYKRSLGKEVEYDHVYVTLHDIMEHDDEIHAKRIELGRNKGPKRNNRVTRTQEAAKATQAPIASVFGTVMPTVAMGNPGEITRGGQPVAQEPATAATTVTSPSVSTSTLTNVFDEAEKATEKTTEREAVAPTKTPTTETAQSKTPDIQKGAVSKPSFSFVG